MSARIEPARAWMTSGPLRCVAEGEVTWLLDGAPAVDVQGAEVPSDRLAPHQRWTCIAARGDRVATDTRRIEPPNVLLVLADDLGQGDVGFTGGRALTPRIDALAAQGVVLSRAYAAAPVCSPSRAGLITGRQPSRFGFEYNANGGGVGLPGGERTMADLVGGVGMSTALFGKWHLGVEPSMHPNVRGFDHFFGFLDGRRPALPPAEAGVRSAFLSEREIELWPLSQTGEPLQRDGMPVEPDERHLTDHIADEAIGWIDAHRQESWMAWVSFQSPHIPLLARQDWLDAVPERDEEAWLYDANLYGMDRAVGRIQDALVELGLDEHTVIVFTSDNGCPEGPVACSNGGLRGAKLTAQEGGVRVPTFVRWPGSLPAGAVVHAATSHLDLVPTVVSAVGAALPPSPVDGVDLLPWLRGGGVGRPHEQLYWRMLPMRAMLLGDEKVVQIWGRTWRFDLLADPGEQQSLDVEDPDGSEEATRLLERRGDVLVEAAWLGTWATGDYYGEETVFMY